MANDNHGHHEHHKDHHGHADDTAVAAPPTPLTFCLQPNNQAIITVAFYGTLQKQIMITEQYSADVRIYTSCVDGRRPYIVINNTSKTQTLNYAITPSMFSNLCSQQTGTSIDLTLQGTMSGGSAQIQKTFYYGIYGAGSTYQSDQVGVTIVIQENIGDLVS